jgi:tetratricopeptide (TPR) repeat protein
VSQVQRSGLIAFTGGTTWLTLSNLWRYPTLWLYRGLGRLQRITTRGWWPFVTTLALVIAILILSPLVLDLAASGLKALGVNGVDPAPKVGEWLSLLNVVLLMIVVLFVRWISSARNRVVVEGFVDFTKDNATAVSGLSTLLVTELGRLRDLYDQIDDLSVPTAVGVEQHGGFGRGKEAAGFLTVSADDVTNVLEGAIASDARIEMGPAKIPIGPVLAFFNRLTRGPRLTGSVHLTEAGGGPTLTAQLIGKESSGTWRVDQPHEPESPEQRKAFLDSMVRELACRMFTQLTLRGSVRWKAVKAFNDYLRFYDESRRTPRDRGRFLKKAQGKLLEAVAEDERFDLAYYNLGVIYTQLAQTELLAEQESDDATSRADFQRAQLNDARREAARVAFLRAAAKNPERWEAYYAQAVTRFSRINPFEIGDTLEPDEKNPEDKKRREDLHAVIALCEQTLAISPKHGATRGAVYDLLGMAQIRLGENLLAALKNHRRAVHRSWMEYCRASRRDRARSTGQPELVDRARANATAALHNLAFAYERRALIGYGDENIGLDRFDLSAAQRIFRWAARLAGDGNRVAAACHFERGRALERAKRYRQAVNEFRRAGRINSRSCEYRACRARALAKRAVEPGWQVTDAERTRLGAQAKTWAERALGLMARPFSLAVTPNTAEALDLECKATLDALQETYEALDDADEIKRMKKIKYLRVEMEEALDGGGGAAQPERPPDLARLLVIKTRLESEAAKKQREWELDQIQLALGRTRADGREWPAAHKIFSLLMERLLDVGLKDRIVEFGLYPHLARSQRESKGSDNYVEALRTAAQSVRRDPLNVEGRREAGRAHFALGQYAEALAAWDHALWLSPSDPYLHYEVAMCHRRMSRDQTDEREREGMISKAKTHFAQAQELFDGEDLDGEAWTRFWRGKIALEVKQPAEALAFLQGAEHGTATAAAALLVGEAHLELEQRPAAAHAFNRCRAALGAKTSEKPKVARLKSRITIDALWGDELPLAAVQARVECGLARALYITPSGWQDPKMASEALRLLKRAERFLRSKNLHEKAPGPHDEAMTRVLDAEGKLLTAMGEVEEALDKVRERLRYESTREALALEAELLDLRAERGKQIDEHTLLDLAADNAWDTVKSNGNPRPRRRRHSRSSRS